MLVTELLEGYEKHHKCLTPNTIYKMSFHSDHINIKLKLPKTVQDVEIENYEDLEADLHYAIEKVLAKHYFKKHKSDQ